MWPKIGRTSSYTPSPHYKLRGGPYHHNLIPVCGTCWAARTGPGDAAPLAPCWPSASPCCQSVRLAALGEPWCHKWWDIGTTAPWWNRQRQLTQQNVFQRWQLSNDWTTTGQRSFGCSRLTWSGCPPHESSFVYHWVCWRWWHDGLPPLWTGVKG